MKLPPSAAGSGLTAHAAVPTQIPTLSYKNGLEMPHISSEHVLHSAWFYPFNTSRAHEFHVLARMSLCPRGQWPAGEGGKGSPHKL